MEEIPLSRPELKDREQGAVREVLSGSRLSLGPRLVAFEKQLSRLAGRRAAVAVSSGTAGLHLAVHALGIGEGDEVITTPFSFVATASCVLMERATPVFVDIEPHTLGLDPAAVEAAITERTRALLPVHVFGTPCRIEELEQIARRHDLPLIEDACEALGSSVALPLFNGMTEEQLDRVVAAVREGLRATRGS